VHRIRVECRIALPPALSVAQAVFGLAGRVEATGAAPWDALVATSAQDEAARVQVTTVGRDPLVLEVASEDTAHARTAAFHLAMETQGRFL
jgi:hypothetical protein